MYQEIMVQPFILSIVVVTNKQANIFNSLTHKHFVFLFFLFHATQLNIIQMHYTHIHKYTYKHKHGI